MSQNNKYNVILENPKSTVVAEYIASKKRCNQYQSENNLEQELIKQLCEQGYTYIDVTSENDLINNLRQQLEKLNCIVFTNKEWQRFYKNELANPNQSIAEKTYNIQEDYIKNLIRDDKSEKNIYLLNKKNIHENNLQVINQYEAPDGKRPNRYDVTILLNGIPLVHIELKRRGVALQEAFNQIQRYQRESFWSASGLFEYIQLFVISNGTHTKYYSNTVRDEHIKKVQNGMRKKGSRTSNSFEFSHWWADEKNQQIQDLTDFTKTFFTPHTLLNVLIHYCVFTSEKKLLVMRPYQIVATEKILNRVELSNNYKKYSQTSSGGYIWHTTGSGKTLTSFKTAQRMADLSFIDKVLFVVDRKDLDYQTMKEFNKFAGEDGAVNCNINTKILDKQLNNKNARIIVTTIQKLNHLFKKYKKNEVFKKHVVIIFDECHRSQFGEMHNAIIKNFKKYHLFGFTGTPIFAENASPGMKPNFKTTEQAFGDKLHTYTIVNAIADKNVLPFKVDYISTMKENKNIEDEEVQDIDRKAALLAPQRITNIVEYILKHFNQKTKRNSYYNLKNRRITGFNSIFAVSSIEAAKKYYTEFKKQLANAKSDEKLKVATIFSYQTNEAENDSLADENLENTKELDASSRDFLESAIEDYNQMFEKQLFFDTSADKFQNYYKDVSQKVKNREIDILIVVNMFLTGFDATTLNTLWVDKTLRTHCLLQAFSRTNRILNSVKTFGNIVSFRNLEKATNQSLALFGDENANGIVLLKTFDEYYNGYWEGDKEFLGYKNLVMTLKQNYPLKKVIVGEEKQKAFIALYGKILKLQNILESFDEFAKNKILEDREIQDYHSKYIYLHNHFRKTLDSNKENINDDMIFEMELIKQIEVNMDYVLLQIGKYIHNPDKHEYTLKDIEKAIDASVEMRNKKDLIIQFIDKLDHNSDVEKDWSAFINRRKNVELDEIIKSEKLNPEATYQFIQNAFQNGYLSTIGTEITKVLPPISRFTKENLLGKKRNTVLQKLLIFFERFFNITNKNE